MHNNVSTGNFTLLSHSPIGTLFCEIPHIFSQLELPFLIALQQKAITRTMYLVSG